MLSIILCAALSGQTFAATPYGDLESAVDGNVENIGQLMDDVEGHEARVTALEAKAAVDCRTSNAACDSTVAALNTEVTSLKTKVDTFDTSIKAVQVWRWGAGASCSESRPCAGSVDYRLAGYDDTLYGSGPTCSASRPCDDGLVSRVTVLEETVKDHEKRIVSLEVDVRGNVDEDGDGISDGLVEETGSDGNVVYRPSLTMQVKSNRVAIADSEDFVWVGLGFGISTRMGYTDPEDVYSFPGISLGANFTIWYQNQRAGRATLGMYGFVAPVTGSGMSTFAGGTAGTNREALNLSIGAGVRFEELASNGGNQFSFRATGLGVPLIVSYDVSDRFRFYGEGMLDITYQAGEFKDEGVKLSSHWAAGALVRF